MLVLFYWNFKHTQSNSSQIESIIMIKNWTYRIQWIFSIKKVKKKLYNDYRPKAELEKYSVAYNSILCHAEQRERWDILHMGCFRGHLTCSIVEPVNDENPNMTNEVLLAEEMLTVQSYLDTPDQTLAVVVNTSCLGNTKNIHPKYIMHFGFSFNHCRSSEMLAQFEMSKRMSALASIKWKINVCQNFIRTGILFVGWFGRALFEAAACLLSATAETIVEFSSKSIHCNRFKIHIDRSAQRFTRSKMRACISHVRVTFARRRHLVCLTIVAFSRFMVLIDPSPTEFHESIRTLVISIS